MLCDDTQTVLPSGMMDVDVPPPSAGNGSPPEGCVRYYSIRVDDVPRVNIVSEWPLHAVGIVKTFGFTDDKSTGMITSEA